MARRYEFNAEEINEVVIVVKDSLYTTMYTRKFDEDGNPTREFIQTYSAQPDDSMGDGMVSVICPRCERWNLFVKADYLSEEFEYDCSYCGDQYEEIVDESDVIEIINTNMDADIFFEVALSINGIEIV